MRRHDKDLYININTKDHQTQGNSEYDIDNKENDLLQDNKSNKQELDNIEEEIEANEEHNNCKEDKLKDGPNNEETDTHAEETSPSEVLKVSKNISGSPTIFEKEKKKKKKRKGGIGVNYKKPKPLTKLEKEGFENDEIRKETMKRANDEFRSDIANNRHV